MAGAGRGLGVVNTGPAAQFPDAGLIEHLLFPLQFLRLALAYPGLDEPAPLPWVGQENLARGLEQPGVFLGGKPRQQQAVGGRLFQDLDGGAQLFQLRFQCSSRQNRPGLTGREPVGANKQSSCWAAGKQRDILPDGSLSRAAGL